jgi:hypothetical protein
MTTIVWDGKTLAADRQICEGSFKYPGTKIFKKYINGDPILVGFYGEIEPMTEYLKWLDEIGRAHV